MNRPPFETFKRPTCKGCYALGTACGTCEKCEWERNQMALGTANPPTFRSELEKLVNRFSAENGSDTPDFILADYLNHCLAIFDGTVKAREEWYGRKCGQGQAIRRDVLDARKMTPPGSEPLA